MLINDLSPELYELIKLRADPKTWANRTATSTVDSVIVWAKTPEGHAFWEGIDEQGINTIADAELYASGGPYEEESEWEDEEDEIGYDDQIIK